MGLILSVRGANINIELSEYEITGFGFIYSSQNSRYAKSSDERCLRIIGSISAMMEHSPAALNAIREWSKIGRVGQDCYTNVRVATLYREEEVRSIIFPDAFIKSYEENIDPHSGQGEFTLMLMQKQDRRTNIIVNPFNQVVERRPSAPAVRQATNPNEQQTAGVRAGRSFNLDQMGQSRGLDGNGERDINGQLARRAGTPRDDTNFDQLMGERTSARRIGNDTSVGQAVNEQLPNQNNNPVPNVEQHANERSRVQRDMSSLDGERNPGGRASSQGRDATIIRNMNDPSAIQRARINPND